MTKLTKGQAQAMRRHARLLERQAAEQRASYDRMRSTFDYFSPHDCGISLAAQATDEMSRVAERYAGQVAHVFQVRGVK